MSDSDEHPLFYVYKLIETLENKFGGEQALIAELKMQAKSKYAKRAASDQSMDERHAPNDLSPDGTQPPCDRATAIRDTLDILRAYEESLPHHDRPDLG